VDWSFLFSAIWDGLFGGVRQRRTLPENVLQNDSRARILDALQRVPGTTLGALCRDLGLRRGTAAYHLKLLERVGVVGSLSTGHTRHFFPKDASEEERKAFTVLQRERALELVREILSTPGIHQGELLARVGMRRKVFRSYVRQFKAEGLLAEHWNVRRRVYEPTAKLRRLAERIGVMTAEVAPRPPRDARGPERPRGGV